MITLFRSRRTRENYSASLPMGTSWLSSFPIAWKHGDAPRSKMEYSSKRSDPEHFHHHHQEATWAGKQARNAPQHRLNAAMWNRLLKVFSIILSLLSLLLPRRGRPVRTKALHELHPLAYLDALRGYLALIIFTGHTMPRHWKWIPDSVLAIPWFQFPFRGGFASLDIFFWISGYAVTYRIIGFVHAKQWDKFLDALASTVFRRYLRLFLPILPITLVAAIAVRTGLAIPPENRRDVIRGNVILWWIQDSGHMVNPFSHILGYWTGATGSNLIDPFWSLCAEFRSSMTLLLVCVGTCKLSCRNRKRLLLICVPPFICWQAQWAAMAFLGMWFAENRQQRRRAPDPARPALGTDLVNGELSEKGRYIELDTKSSTSMRFTGYVDWCSSLARRRRTPLLIILFLYSFVVLKDPYDTDKKTLFPHNILNLFVPDHWHGQMRMHMHLVIGSTMMLYPLDQVPVLQRPLLSPFSQFLGELSFGIFAVHYVIRWVVWEERYVKWQMDRYGNDAFNQFWIAFPGWLGMAFIVLWAAELFRRLDMQVVRFCKYLEAQLFE